MTDRLRVIRTHSVRDRFGNTFGILDVNPDPDDPAIALGVNPADGGERRSPIVRPGNVLDLGAVRWRAIEVQTAEQPAFVVLESEQATDPPSPVDA